MHWTFLVIAGLFEVSWAIGLKYSHGFTLIIPSILTIVCMILSFYFLSLALKSLPIGIAYSIWTGIGTIGTVILGILLFKEPLTAQKTVCILFIISGICGLKFIPA